MKRKQKRSSGSVPLPSGFTAMGGSDRAPSWIPEPGDQLQGTVMGKRDLDAKKAGRKNAKKGETVTIVTVADGDGVLHNVWESHALGAAFKAAKVGDEIFIRLNEIVKRGRKQFKDFTVGLKQKGKR